MRMRLRLQGKLKLLYSRLHFFTKFSQWKLSSLYLEAVQTTLDSFLLISTTT